MVAAGTNVLGAIRRLFKRPPTVRLSDGARARVGLRVVKVREVLDGWGLGHAYDDEVHQITMLHVDERHGSLVTLEIGPEQVSHKALREAPRRAALTCRQCDGWHERLTRWQAAMREKKRPV